MTAPTNFDARLRLGHRIGGSEHDFVIEVEDAVSGTRIAQFVIDPERMGDLIGNQQIDAEGKLYSGEFIGMEYQHESVKLDLSEDDLESKARKAGGQSRAQDDLSAWGDFLQDVFVAQYGHVAKNLGYKPRRNGGGWNNHRYDSQKKSYTIHIGRYVKPGTDPHAPVRST